MNNLLVITQKVDESDDLLGFFIGWLNGFSKEFDKVFVITLFKDKYNLPDNVFVYSLGKEKGFSKLKQVFRFYYLLFRLMPQVIGVFAHMSPLFAIASWPVAFIWRKKVVLWYLHRSLTAKLKLANVLCYKIVTATKESLRLKSSKILEVGHGIDVDLFKTERNWFKKSANLVSVGRISPIKGLGVLIKALKVISEIDNDIKLKIIGRPVMPSDNAYLLELKKTVLKLNMNKFIEFNGFIPYKHIPEVYRKADLSINLTPTGGVDKSVLESMAAGLLVLTSNKAFQRYFGEYSSILIFEHNDQTDLINKIKHLIFLSSKDKDIISAFLVRSVTEHHLLRETIGRLSNILNHSEKFA